MDCWLRRWIEQNRRDRAISRFRSRNKSGTVTVLQASACTITIEDRQPVALHADSLVKAVNARLTSDQAARLDAYAARERTTLSGAIQRLTSALPPPADGETRQRRPTQASAYR